MRNINISISKVESLKYRVSAKGEGEEIDRSLYFTMAEELDGYFLLHKDTTGRREKLFGVTKDKKVADKRLYDAAKEISKMFMRVYSDENHSVKVEDNTSRGKENQLEIELKEGEIK